MKQNYLAQAERAMRTGDLEQARALLVTLVTVEPEHRTAWLLLAELVDDPAKQEVLRGRGATLPLPPRPAVGASWGSATGKGGPALTDLQEARGALARATDTYLEAVLASGRKPEAAPWTAELRAAADGRTNAVEVFEAALEIYEQACELLEGTRSLVEERNQVALRLEQLLLKNGSQEAVETPEPAQLEPASPQVRQILEHASHLAGMLQSLAATADACMVGQQILLWMERAGELDPARAQEWRKGVGRAALLQYQEALELSICSPEIEPREREEQRGLYTRLAALTR